MPMSYGVSQPNRIGLGTLLALFLLDKTKEVQRSIWDRPVSPGGPLRLTPAAKGLGIVARRPPDLPAATRVQPDREPSHTLPSSPFDTSPYFPQPPAFPERVVLFFLGIVMFV